MASDYNGIRADNERRYGTDIGRIGPMLLADRYDDRTHFIFELLQNAEDALARRPDWQGSRAVVFNLTHTALRVSHFGKPFDEGDVRGVCGIAESTKDLTAIGRFGIGFKSVYAFTDRPEIHSGAEDFALENFVWPAPAPPVDRHEDETVIVLPLRERTGKDHEVIAAGLQRLGAGTLLFLRQIEEISWSVDGGPSGLYLRSKPELVSENVRRITVIGQEEGRSEVEETWLLFSRPVAADDGVDVGHVELAFSIAMEEESGRDGVEPVKDSPLVVFFPTVLPTHLGFLVQGPYRTTPSRDNVPRSDPWNQSLVNRTATLLGETLRWLRDHDLLDSAALRCLPLDRAHFGDLNMFAPLFEATRRALASDSLLPRYDGGHVSAANARLARTQELRELIGPSQLAAIFGPDGELAWLSSDITQDRTPELRQYLMRELGIAEVTPEAILTKLDRAFLESQTDEWILSLYEFLNSQPALRRRLGDLPLIRLQNGKHVVAYVDGQPQAFLPSPIQTDFPTVRAAVCGTVAARELLRFLGLTEPDPVDDVVWNVLPRYYAEVVDVTDEEYPGDVRRILAAFTTDSKGQREKLVAALRGTAFVRAVDAGDGSTWFSQPNGAYLATERLRDLFAGVTDVLLVDDSCSCLRGDDVRELLEACGATRYLQPVPVTPSFTWEQKRSMRVAAGCESSSGGEQIEDTTLRGLDGLLSLLPTLPQEARKRRAALLWEALGDVEGRRGTGAFAGTYRWTYIRSRSASFDAAFVRILNQSAWVPDVNGELQRPEFILFDTLGWVPSAFLQSKIHFKPPAIEMLAREAGIEPGVLDLLKKLGVTSEAELRSKLGIAEDALQRPDGPPAPRYAENAVQSIPDGARGLRATVPGPGGAEAPEAAASGGGPSSSANGRGAAAEGDGSGGRSTRSSEIEERSALVGESVGRRTPGSAGGRPFISYVGMHQHGEESDPDGLEHAARTALEEKAIELILRTEPQLQRTPSGNPGFDLFEFGADGKPARWIEVKAMTGGLHDRPVGISHTQFACARQYGAAYWLYVVEQASNASARIVRIQDPVGRARTFTFDQGWLDIADGVSDHSDRKS